jgi:uncharacterized lipoprotein YddW (UPF0748 family)
MRLFLVGLVSALAATATAGPAEVRGLWVVRTGLVSPESVDAVVDSAVAGGFNTLLVQVRGRGDAFYQSSLVSRSVLLHGRPDFDPLARLLERARARNLHVHAWINVLLSAHFGQPLPADHIVLRHPEWVMVPRKAVRAGLAAKGRDVLRVVAEASPRSEVEGYYISPSAPGVPEHLESVVRELLQHYALDGLHLDFIRYPNGDFDYSRAALESFQQAQGGGDLLAPATKPSAAWDEHRRTLLTALAGRLAGAARRERPGMIISAAVVPAEAQAVNHKFQAWPSWIASGLLDAICPMAYTPDPQLFRTQIEQARGLARSGQAVWAGVGAYRLTVGDIVKNIQSAREVGASGVVLFSHESLDAASLETLRRQAFSGPTFVASAPVLLAPALLTPALP